MKRVWTYPGEDSGSDHILLVGYLRMDLKKCGKAEPKLQLKVLKDDAYVKEFCQKVEKRYRHCGNDEKS